MASPPWKAPGNPEVWRAGEFTISMCCCHFPSWIHLMVGSDPSRIATATLELFTTRCLLCLTPRCPWWNPMPKFDGFELPLTQSLSLHQRPPLCPVCLSAAAPRACGREKKLSENAWENQCFDRKMLTYINTEKHKLIKIVPWMYKTILRKCWKHILFQQQGWVIHNRIRKPLE